MVVVVCGGGWSVVVLGGNGMVSLACDNEWR